MPTGPIHIQGASRAEREILHGRHLAVLETETVWGWGTPAGQLRARRRAGLIAEGARLSPGQRALEIGCGTGLFTEMFASRGAEIVAVDISGELLAKARARNLPAGQVTFLEKRFEDCDVDGPFDAVIGSSILHHLDIAGALTNIRRLLKPGGILSFAEPNMLNPQVYLERKFHYLPMFSYTSPDETAFVRWKFARLLREHGFQEISITPFDWLHPAVPRPLIAAVRGVGRLLERLPGLREFSGSLYIRARSRS
ncbi:MAG TPA: class I SAM-dependent methyltransferase [Bryobacteraceae bacterium]|jgi:2-polyprenyl-3-methyl-5-hydroxy-6-metoxy-1,4-benzoquinol methylase|nr:class I SAM-dependent methyltransferase [Bryobacteraceae bacterium]